MPEPAGLTVAVLFVLLNDILPEGVNVPVELVVDPVNVGRLTEPSGVNVTVPEAALLTVAVVPDVVSPTLPDGVKLPVDVKDVPENVGWLTVPAGV